MSLPACAAALFLTLYAIEESTEPEGRRLDLPGQILAIIALGGFAFAAIEGSHWGWTTPLACDCCLRRGCVRLDGSTYTGAIFAAVAPEPTRHFGGTRGLMTFGMYALLFITPLYFQTIRGATPFIAGLELLPMSLSFVVVSQLVGYLTNNLGPRIVMAAGMACMGFGALAIAFIPENTSPWSSWRSLLSASVLA